jgi:hypothetical protein
MANSAVAGYFGGGSTGSPVTTVEKFAFPADTRSTLGTGLSSARNNLAAMAGTDSAGYFGGGASATTVDKFAFPSDTRSTLGTGLTTATDAPAGMANEGPF